MRALITLVTICLGSFVVWLVFPASGTVDVTQGSRGTDGSRLAVSEVSSTSFSEGMVTVAFDDAWRSQYTEALPILEAAGVKATFYITTEPVEKGWGGFMTREQIKDLADKGHEIGSHTVSHHNLSRLSSRAVLEELTVSKQYLEKLTGQTVKNFAYPNGDVALRVEKQVVEAGYLSARGVRIGDLITPASDRLKLNALLPSRRTPLTAITAAIEEAKAKKRWLIIAFHKVDRKGGLYSFSPARFQAAIDAIKAAGIKTVTVSGGVALMEQQTVEKTGG